MDLKVTDLENTIDEVFQYEEIKELTSEGIVACERLISFEKSKESMMPQSLGDNREYVGSRNCLTEPPYMKFTVDDEIIIILFQNRDDYYSFYWKIRKLGYDTFDLS